MNILFICHRLPYPPDKGERIRAFHEIRLLAQRHRVHVATFLERAADRDAADDLRALGIAVTAVRRDRIKSALSALRAVLRGLPPSVGWFGSGELQRVVRSLVRNEHVDIVIAFSSVMAQYLDPGWEIPRILDYIDLDSEKWRLFAATHRGPRAWVYALEARRLASYERSQGARGDAVIFISNVEAALYRAGGGTGNVSIVSSGVDMDYFAPRTPDIPREPIAVFVGAMDYWPNVDAVVYFSREVLPLIRASHPNARFRIVGRNPSAAVRALATHPSIEVTGSVPDVRPHVLGARVSVAPLRIACGLQSKILEAMAMGRGVVATSGVARGIADGPIAGLTGCDDPVAFSSAVARFFDDDEHARSEGLRARIYVERFHRWEDRGGQLESILKGAQVHAVSRPTP